MANSGRITTGSMPRLVQLGVDAVLKSDSKTYQGVGSEVFTKVATDKAFYEAVQLAGMGYAAIKGEGAPVQMDSIDQDWVYRWPIISYAKAGRVSFEEIQDNLYEDLIPMIGKQIAKGLNATRDFNMAQVLNNGYTVTGPKGEFLFSASHAVQAGGTTSNLLTPGLNMSEDAIEQMVIIADTMVNPDGLPSDYQTKDLIVPVQLRFEADRVVNSKYRVGTTDNDISAISNQSVVKRVIPWKRITDTNGFFLTTDAENGLMVAEKKAVATNSFSEPNTMDVIVTAYERYRTFWASFYAAIGSQGAS